MIIKFNPENKPSYVVQDKLLENLDVNGNVIEEIIGYRVHANGIGDVRLQAGDYLRDDGGIITVIKAADYQASDFIKNEIHELVGKDVVRDLYRALRAQNLTQAQEGDLLNRVFPVLAALGDGFINGARVICNNLTVAGQLTLARKNYLLGKIDEAIALL